MRMKKILEQRFKEFLKTLTEVENIDNLNMTQQQKDASKADYFAENRQLIIELKSLETDTEPKIEKIIEPHRSRPEFPVFFGKWEVNKVLKHLPDGDEINKQINKAITSSLQTIYRSANKQIRTTKSTFNLLNSQGLLIVLNEKIDVLTPENIIYRLRQVAQKKNPDRSYQFLNINSILLISEAHFSPTSNNLMAFPIIHVSIEVVDSFQYDNFIRFLKTKWSEYNKIPLIDAGKVNSIKDLNLKSVLRSKEENEKYIPRQEVWRRYYKRNPYFRPYDENMLCWMFKMIMSELTPGFFKGATQEQQYKVRFWIEVFTHFMEEVDYRGIDIRFFSSVMKEHGKEIENEMKKRFPDLDYEKD
ncbi:hypothetical protein BH10ACI1_BH10ACI1_15770 [soil metagenome]